MRTSSNDVGVLTYPESVFFTKGKDAYVKFQFKSGRRGEEIALTIIAGGEKIFTLNRISNAVATVVINVCDLLEALFAERAISYAVDWRFMIDYPFEDDDWDLGGEDYQPFVCNFDFIIRGYSDKELYIPFHSTISPPPYPLPRRIVIYPNIHEDIKLFAPFRGDVYAILKYGDNSQRINGEFVAPFYVFNPTQTFIWGNSEKIELRCNNGLGGYDIQYSIDTCTDGFWLKWIDKYGLPYMYRWSVASSTEGIDEEDIIVQLDDTMHPIERRTKTITQEYTLHSRRVEQDIFDLCKSVIGCQELTMYNDDTGQWEPCFVSDSQAEDNGDILKDLVVTVSKYEYL